MESPARVAAVRASRLLDAGPEASFDRITALAATILGTPMTYMTVVDDVRSELKGAPDSAAMCGPDGRFSAPVYEATCQLVINTGREIVVPDTAADLRTRDLAQIKAFGAASWVGVPIVDPDGYVLGNLCGMDAHPREWTEADLRGLRTLAQTVDETIALRLAGHRLQTYAQQTHELAETLQQSLVPLLLPQIPGLAVAARFHPGGTGVEVLGDFYDVVPTLDGVGITVGDVCGKGATAARTTALVRSAIRTAGHLDADPAAVLGTVHEVLLDWFRPQRSFVTAALASLVRGPDHWAVRVGSAGHTPGFVRRSDGHVDELAAGGRVLGLTDEPRVQIEDVALDAGDTLVLCTDGITEARDPDGVQLDEPGVAAALAAAPLDADAEELADALVDAAHRHAGHTNTDDLVVVVVQVPLPL